MPAPWRRRVDRCKMKEKGERASYGSSPAGLWPAHWRPRYRISSQSACAAESAMPDTIGLCLMNTCAAPERADSNTRAAAPESPRGAWNEAIARSPPQGLNLALKGLAKLVRAALLGRPRDTLPFLAPHMRGPLVSFSASPRLPPISPSTLTSDPRWTRTRWATKLCRRLH